MKYILIHDYAGAVINDDPYTGTDTEAEAKRRTEQHGGAYYTISEALRPVYTREQWANDKDFKAEPGQEITEDIYTEMYNCMPPLPLPAAALDLIRSKYGKEITKGFLLGEPHDCNKNGLTYLSFGKCDGKYYFFGDMNR